MANQVQQFYSQITSKTIYESFRMWIFRPELHNLVLDKEYLFGGEFSYKDRIFTADKSLCEIDEMVKNLTLIEMRELLIAYSSEIVVSAYYDRNGNICNPAITPLEKVKVTIDILTSTIHLYSDENIQQIQDLTTANDSLTTENNILRTKNDTLTTENSILEKRIDTARSILL